MPLKQTFMLIHYYNICLPLTTLNTTDNDKRWYLIFCVFYFRKRFKSWKNKKGRAIVGNMNPTVALNLPNFRN